MPQLSTALRNGSLNSITTNIGASAVIRLFTGTIPANCAAADAGTKLVEFELPATWMTTSTTGSIEKTGEWPVETALASGTASYYRVYDSTGTTCHIQGPVSGLAGSGEMKLRKVAITLTDPIEILTFKLTDPHV